MTLYAASVTRSSIRSPGLPVAITRVSVRPSSSPSAGPHRLPLLRVDADDGFAQRALGVATVTRRSLSPSCFSTFDETGGVWSITTGSLTRSAGRGRVRDRSTAVGGPETEAVDPVGQRRGVEAVVVFLEIFHHLEPSALPVAGRARPDGR